MCEAQRASLPPHPSPPLPSPAGAQPLCQVLPKPQGTTVGESLGLHCLGASIPLRQEVRGRGWAVGWQWGGEGWWGNWPFAVAVEKPWGPSSLCLRGQVDFLSWSLCSHLGVTRKVVPAVCLIPSIPSSSVRGEAGGQGRALSPLCFPLYLLPGSYSTPSSPSP